MNPLSTKILGRFQRQANDTMLDTGAVLLRTDDAVDSHNRPTYEYVEQEEIACGVKIARNVEASDAEGNVVLVDYQIRLPHGTAVSAHDRFRIIARYGSDYPSVVCEIVGAVSYGPTAVLINCREVTHGR